MGFERYGPPLLAVVAVLLALHLVYEKAAESQATQECTQRCSEQNMAPILTSIQLFPRQYQCHCNTASTTPEE